jgi:hypothetical protein
MEFSQRLGRNSQPLFLKDSLQTKKNKPIASVAVGKGRARLCRAVTFSQEIEFRLDALLR